MYTIYNLQASFGGFKPDPSGVVKALARISGAEARRDIYPLAGADRRTRFLRNRAVRFLSAGRRKDHGPERVEITDYH